VILYPVTFTQPHLDCCNAIPNQALFTLKPVKDGLISRRGHGTTALHCAIWTNDRISSS